MVVEALSAGLSTHLVPLVEGLNKLVIGEATDSLEHIICLTDELHVTVLNAIVHHLDKVTRAAWRQQSMLSWTDEEMATLYTLSLCCVILPILYFLQPQDRGCDVQLSSGSM